jgi:hypothetical protein
MDRRALRSFKAPFVTALLSAALMSGATACGGKDEPNEGLQKLHDAGIDQIAFISRAKRIDVGDVFQYTTFSVDPKSANIFKLSTVSGGAEPEAITPFGSGEWAAADIMAMDVSFDGQEIVFSARLENEPHFSLWRIKIDGSNPEEPGKSGPARIFNGPFDAVYPVYLPKERIFFMTNQTVAPGVKQFRDEYERGATAQAATIDLHGGDLQLGPRNLSHRVSPTLIATPTEGGPLQGQILHTNWDHINNVNEGNLMVMNPDLTGGAEFFGKEGNGVANSYLKPRQIDGDEFLAIATDREDTFQAGAIIKIKRGKNESDSRADVLTPDVPRSKEPSYDRIGRYYDAFPITGEGGGLTDILVSWANGPVQSEVAGGGMSEDGIDYGEGSGPPDFGLYVLEPGTNHRLPVFNDPDMWDVLPMPIGIERPEPTTPSAPSADDAPDGTALIGALNVFESSLATVPDDPGAAGRIGYRVRVIEGFSVEEGIPDDFGITEADGAILLGEAPVHADGSFAAYVPEDRPMHLQLVDPYGLAVVNEDRWFSADAGEDRFCGGCHEARGDSQLVNPGLSEAVGVGPRDFSLAYDQRVLPDAGGQVYADLVAKVVEPANPDYADYARIRGIPWDIAVQPMFDDAGCVDCHEGTPGPANPSVTITDTESPNPQSTPWVFDLRGEKVDFTYGMMTGNYTRSHISLLLVAGIMSEPGVELEMDPAQPYQEYIVPENAQASVIMRYANPHRLYPTEDTNDLAFDDVAKNEPYQSQTYDAQHPSDSTPGYDPTRHRPLTKYEKYLLGIVADLGGQYYSIENAPGTEY